MAKSVQKAIDKLDFLNQLLYDVSPELSNHILRDKLMRHIADIILKCRTELVSLHCQLSQERLNRRRRQRVLHELKQVSLSD